LSFFDKYPWFDARKCAQDTKIVNLKRIKHIPESIAAFTLVGFRQNIKLGEKRPLWLQGASGSIAAALKIIGPKITLTSQIFNSEAVKTPSWH
jgi:hypothetical protein